MSFMMHAGGLIISESRQMFKYALTAQPSILLTGIPQPCSSSGIDPIVLLVEERSAASVPGRVGGAGAPKEA